MRGLVAATPLLRITVSMLSLREVQDHVASIARVNEVLTQGGDLKAAYDAQAETLGAVEIMARAEAGLEAGLGAFATERGRLGSSDN